MAHLSHVRHGLCPGVTFAAPLDPLLQYSIPFTAPATAATTHPSRASNLRARRPPTTRSTITSDEYPYAKLSSPPPVPLPLLDSCLPRCRCPPQPRRSPERRLLIYHTAGTSSPAPSPADRPSPSSSHPKLRLWRCASISLAAEEDIKAGLPQIPPEIHLGVWTMPPPPQKWMRRSSRPSPRSVPSPQERRRHRDGTNQRVAEGSGCGATRRQRATSPRGESRADAGGPRQHPPLGARPPLLPLRQDRDQFRGNSYRSYSTREEAEARWMNHLLEEQDQRKRNQMKTFAGLLAAVTAVQIYFCW